MGKFSAPLTVTKVGPDTWQIEREFSYTTDACEVIVVPAGFITDFASVPWGFRNFFPKDYDGTQAAVMHDWLYNQRHVHGFPREKCDKLFLVAMRDLNVGWVRRHTMYRAVRMGGWAFWNKKSDVTNVISETPQ